MVAQVAIQLATAASEALVKQREEQLASAKAIHLAEIEQHKELSDKLAAQREKQFAELLALEKERQRHEMADAKALLEAGLVRHRTLPYPFVVYALTYTSAS